MAEKKCELDMRVDECFPRQTVAVTEKETEGWTDYMA